jgi:iron complex transport system permease protein
MARSIPSAVAARGATLVRPAALRMGALPVLALALCGSIVLATTIGAVPISPWHTAGILLDATLLVHIRPTWSAAEAAIIVQLRLPGVLGAALVGAALAVAGALFQGLLRNPLADPLLLGTSSGAALGATVAYLIPAIFSFALFGFSLVAIFAFAGALAAVAVVYRLATRRGQTPVITLLLAGVAVSAILTAVQTLLLALDAQLGLHLRAVYGWITGAISVQSWAQVQVVAVVLLVTVPLALWMAPTLDAFALGEEMSAHLGIDVERAKLAIVALASLLVAAAVSISGLVGFVGLVAPHLCRMILGPRHRLLIAASALGGAIFVVLADLLARTIAAPQIIPLGVVTALVGGPFFLALLARSGGAYRW